MHELQAKALQLSGESAALLERWLALYAAVVEAAEEEGLRPPELREFVNFLTALKRCLEIETLCTNTTREGGNEGDGELDPESLRRLFSGGAPEDG